MSWVSTQVWPSSEEPILKQCFRAGEGAEPCRVQGLAKHCPPYLKPNEKKKKKKGKI